MARQSANFQHNYARCDSERICIRTQIMVSAALYTRKMRERARGEKIRPLRKARIHSTRVHWRKISGKPEHSISIICELACAPHYDSRGERSKKENEMRSKWRELFCSDRPPTRAASTLCNQCDARAVPVAYRRSIGAGGRAGCRAIHLFAPFLSS